MMLKKLRDWLWGNLLLLFVIVVLQSCQDGIVTPSTESEVSEADSIVKNIHSIDSLIALRQIHSEKPYWDMVVCKKLGKLYRENNNFIAALEAHSRQLDCAQMLCDTAEMIYALNNMGTNYRRMSMLDDAAQYHYQALNLCEQYSDKSSYYAVKNRVVSLNGIGNISLSMGDDVTADSVFRVALEGERQLGSALGQAINYANIGAIYERKGELDSAWNYYQHSMEKNIEANSQLGIALCHGYFGGIYEKRGEISKAIEEYEKGYLMKSSIDRWHWLNSCLSLAAVYVNEGQYAKAKELLEEALIDASEGRSLGHLEQIYSLYCEIYRNTGNYAGALEAYKLRSAYKDSVDNKQNLIKIQNERVRYEYQRRQQEIDLIHSEYTHYRKSRNIILSVMLFAIVVFIVALCLLVYAIKIKKREKNALLHIDNMRTSFFTNITHEFRSPLTIIIGLGDKLSKQIVKEPADLSNTGNMISRQGRNLLLLVNQILDLSKVKSSVSVCHYKHGDIIGYIYMIVEGAQLLAQEKDIKMSFVPQPKCVEMDFDPDNIPKIVGNIITNAIKFTQRGGNINVRTLIEDDMLRISVIDDGCGILPEDLPFIFEAFYEGRNFVGEVGSGIGLALAKQLVEAMNGKIEVSSTVGCGSEFTVLLPMHQKDATPLLQQDIDMSTVYVQKNVEMDTDIEDAIDKELTRVLVVEDNKDISRFIASVINDAQLYFAYNGQDGLNMAMDLMPDIIITDIMMPIMNGIEMCREIRKSKVLNHIPIIAISARASEEDKLLGLKSGIDAYLYKPFNSDELNTTLSLLLERRRIMQENITRNVVHEPTSTDEISANNQMFLNKVIDIVYKQMAQQKVNIVDIASAMGMTQRQLNRKINAITGENVSKYVLDIRMTRARQLLDSPKNHSIAEVAMYCGYEENSNFTRSFKSYYNITPTQYRRTP